ncbi:MAG: hypothetical protein QOG67_2720, partial [Verrucomicrobiota bacterium]
SMVAIGGKHPDKLHKVQARNDQLLPAYFITSNLR